MKEIIERSKKIRSQYHKLEVAHHGSEWSLEEDALAFLTDAGLVGRNIMSHQKRWPKDHTDKELKHKLGECFWWLIVLADRLELKPEEVINDFLDSKF